MPPKVNILRDSSPGAITEVVSLSGVGLIMTEKEKNKKGKQKGT
jgi:predicted transcriptional regulator